MVLFDGRFEFRLVEFELFAFGLLDVEWFAFGGVKGRNPPFAFPLSWGVGRELVAPVGRFALLEFAGVNGRFPAEAGPRACLGDMVGG